MKRYQIWDKVSPVITPIGEVLTAEQWKERYPIALLDTITIVGSAGDINGGFFGVLSEMVKRAEDSGCDFSGCETDEARLERIETFEIEMQEAARLAAEEQAAAEAAALAEAQLTQDRTADALEDLVLIQELSFDASMGGGAPVAVTASLDGEEGTVSHSPGFKHLKERFDNDRLSITMLRKYVIGGRITTAEYTEITGIEF